MRYGRRGIAYSPIRQFFVGLGAAVGKVSNSGKGWNVSMTEGHDHEPEWLTFARELQAIAQAGLTYARDPFDLERYEQVRRLAVRLFADGFRVDPVRLHEVFAGMSGYATPQIDVRGAVFRDDQVLLVRDWSDGKWTLPGGWADVNHSPAENVVREVKEESGLDVTVRKLAGIYDRRRHAYTPPDPRHVYKFYFVCDAVGGALATSHETTAVDYFPLSDLPELSRARVLASHIRRVYDHHLDANLPTDFD
jgi:ADP-ribose pyrophosphatase YjhB (NUDIX family)